MPTGGQRVGLLGIGEGGEQRAVGIVLDALIEEEPRVALQRSGPGGVEDEQFAEGSAGGGLALGSLEAGGLEQGLEAGAFLFEMRGIGGGHGGEDGGLLPLGVGEGGIHALLLQDAGHLAQDGAGIGLAVEQGEAGGEVIDAGEAGLVRGGGGGAQALAGVGFFLQPGGGEVGVELALGGLAQVGFDFREIKQTGPVHPHTAKHKCEEKRKYGEGFESDVAVLHDLVFHFRLLALEGEDFLAQGEDGFFQLVGIGWGVVAVGAGRERVPVVALAGALVLGFEVGFGIEGVGLGAEEDIDAEALVAALRLQAAPDVILELGVAAAERAGRQRGRVRLRPITHADEMDEGLAVRDFLVVEVGEGAPVGVKAGLLDGVAPDLEQGLLDELARAAQVAAGGGDENMGRALGESNGRERSVPRAGRRAKRGEAMRGGRIRALAPKRDWLRSASRSSLVMRSNLGSCPAAAPAGLLRLVGDPAALRSPERAGAG